jgi:hypothetical protein
MKANLATVMALFGALLGLIGLQPFRPSGLDRR